MSRFESKVQDKEGREFTVHSTYLIVTPGILADQHTLGERGIHHQYAFTGRITFAGQYRGADSAAGGSSAYDKVRLLAALSNIKH